MADQPVNENEERPIVIEEGAASNLTPEDEALLQFGKDAIAKSVENVRDYSKSMVTLVTAFFAAYFAIMKFVGAETLSSLTQPADQILKQGAMVPPILFVLSIATFVVSVIPLTGAIVVNNLDSVREYRNRTVQMKHIIAYVATGFFVAGIVVTIFVGYALLIRPPPP